MSDVSPSAAAITHNLNPDNFHTTRKFVNPSPLRAYLSRKLPERRLLAKEEFTLNEILQYLKEIISREILYDQRNPAIILCDREGLEDALGMRALHLSEIRERVCRQLYEVDGESATNGGSGAAAGNVAPLATPAASNCGGGRGDGAAAANGNGSGENVEAPSLGGQAERRNGSSPPASSSSSSTTTSSSPSPSSSSPASTLQPSLPLLSNDGNATSTSSPPVAVVQPYRPPPPATAASPANGPAPPAAAASNANNATNANSNGNGRPVANPLVTANIAHETQFKVKPAFLRVLRKLHTVDPSRTIFTYLELTKLLSQYILLNKQRFFDDRNIKVALVENDDLGIAFGVKAFHRTQVTGFLRSQLIELTEAEKRERETRRRQDGQTQQTQQPDSSTPEAGNTTNGNGTSAPSQNNGAGPTTSQNNMDVTVASNNVNVNGSSGGVLIIGAVGGPVSAVGVTAAGASVRIAAPNLSALPSGSSGPSSLSSVDGAVNRRKRPNSADRSSGNSSDGSMDSSPTLGDDAMESASKRRRQRGSHRLSIGVLVDKDGYSSDETIYSMQGYDTVPVGTDDDTDENSSDAASHHSFEVELTEYEIDSEADNDEVPGDNAGDTEEDSDIPDIKIDVVIEADDTNDGWADSESDLDLSNYDPEAAPMPVNWKCLSCGTPNPEVKGQCNKCWKKRQAWIPERPRPRRQRKNKDKRTSGLAVKASTITVARVTTQNSDVSEMSGEEGAVKKPSLDDLDGKTQTSTAADSGFSSQNLEDEHFSNGSSDPEEPVDGATAGPSTSGAARRNNTVATSKPDLLCNFCLSRDKNAGIVHGRITHQICCYPCAKKLWAQGKPCPLCRRKIERITKIISG